ncbi:hypothetical protein B0H14DRAFT_2390177 [Mycena olivaceomarginata]|nr:hypothetical protein B0H14DRAFT_2390177 [Mycena olivaceomarginata]
MTTSIQGPNDPVLAHTQLQRIIVCITSRESSRADLLTVHRFCLNRWPGYRHVEWWCTILVTSPITCGALVVQIASSFAHFVEVRINISFLPSLISYY